MRSWRDSPQAVTALALWRRGVAHASPFSGIPRPWQAGQSVISTVVRMTDTEAITPGTGPPPLVGADLAPHSSRGDGGSAGAGLADDRGPGRTVGGIRLDRGGPGDRAAGALSGRAAVHLAAAVPVLRLPERGHPRGAAPFRGRKEPAEVAASRRTDEEHLAADRLSPAVVADQRDRVLHGGRGLVGEPGPAALRRTALGRGGELGEHVVALLVLLPWCCSSPGRGWRAASPRWT